MNPKSVEIIAKLDKSIRVHDITDIAANFRMAVGLLGKENFKVIIGYLNIYKKIIHRDLDLFILFLNTVKPETQYIEKLNNDNLYHHFIKEGRWDVCSRLLGTEAVFDSENLKGKTPLDLILDKIKSGDGEAIKFYNDNYCTPQILKAIDNSRYKDELRDLGMPIMEPLI